MSDIENRAFFCNACVVKSPKNSGSYTGTTLTSIISNGRKLLEHQEGK